MGFTPRADVEFMHLSINDKYAAFKIGHCYLRVFLVWNQKVANHSVCHKYFQYVKSKYTSKKDRVL